MDLITHVPIVKSHFPIDYQSKIVSIGSCFAENMAAKFDYFQFSNSVNPFGILFHPLAIEKAIKWVVDGHSFSDSGVFYHNERWHCFDAHSDLSHPDKDRLLENLNAAVVNMGRDLREATHIILTLGTAHAYRESASGELVANCHKVPQSSFAKELLPISIIVESLEQTASAIANLNPTAKIILTISPVRHLRDGFVGNQHSKAHLIAAVHQAVLPNATYFPSYEIMMDELRDYRFYADDLLHPSPMAVDYIWERFALAWIADEALPIMAEVDSIRKGLAHRPFNPESQSHQRFLKAIDEKAANLQRRFPHIRF